MMKAELVVVNGPLAGTRYDLSKGDVFIGRDPNAKVRLADPDVIWRHCQIKQLGGRFLIVDLRSPIGTYVNGMRSAERWLEDRDQIGVGATILMFRSGDAGADETANTSAETKPVLLAACSLVFLFRALAAAAAEAGAQTGLLQGQIVRLISDLVPSDEGALVLGSTAPELLARYEALASPKREDFTRSVPRIIEEGAIHDAESGVIGVPLYLAGVLRGIILVRVPDREAERLNAHLDTLTAIASLASVGFEANREVESLKEVNSFLQEQISTNTGIVGSSPAIRALLSRIDRVAPQNVTVLITGESGTGKELIARAIHNKSPRNAGNFVAVNCAAVNETLFESELFGHEKGAFTGAIATRKGSFERAQNGTIFLDEIGELPLVSQPKLLRVLQEKEFERVGGTQVYPLDVRVIAATNRDLTEDVRTGKFREDLYHRLNVVRIKSPALRERKEDIPVLARFFLQRAAERVKRQVQGFSTQAEEMLMSYSWPGNVRELENSMEHAAVLGNSEWVMPEDLPDSFSGSSALEEESSTRYHESVDQARKEAILDSYVKAGGDYKEAAAILKLHPNYLLRLVRNLNLRDEIKKRLNDSKK
jgi:transcriptional regulator with GAF, ATPase, and Fis domain